jgi:hypothetical protein
MLYSLFLHAFFDGNGYGDGCANHGVVARLKIVFFAILKCIKKCRFFHEKYIKSAQNSLILYFVVLIHFKAFFIEMWTRCGHSEQIIPMVAIE